MNLPEKGNISFAIYNELGQVVYEKTDISQKQLSINLTNQPNGVYWLSIKSILGNSTTKIIKQE